MHCSIRYISSLDNNLVIKITDTALSRDLFPNDYHCLGDNENRPVKWLAIEAILDRRFTPSSDVVSISRPYIIETMHSYTLPM